MKLYLICDDIEAGDNSDLFVRTVSPAAAIQYWRGYYILPPDSTPERIIEVPDTLGTEGAIDWDSITQHKAEK